MLTVEQQRELRDCNAELERRLQEQRRELTEKDHRIKKLKWEIAELKRKLFGGTQGETVSDEQLQLQLQLQLALAELEAEPINYSLSQWDKLTVYLDHPQTRIDNDLTEQSIRPCKLGAKNWLFIGHPGVGHRSAVIYTLIETCKRHGIEPQAYLTDVLQRLPSMTNHEAEELTPDKWKYQVK